jgi:hypothetical protein
LRKIENHLAQEAMANERAEIGMDAWIKTNIRLQNNRPDLFVPDKRNNGVTIVEMGITSQDQHTRSRRKNWESV